MTKLIDVPMNRDTLALALDKLTDLCGTRAEDNGWNNDFPQREDFADTERGEVAYQNAVRNWDAVKVSLFAGEAFEAFEELRNGHAPGERYYSVGAAEVIKNIPGKPEGVPSEIVDILVRVFHYAHFRGIPLGEAFFEKLDYNDSRGIRHGGKGF
jgi:NTP pyrophosphatase (non-canonical NTP hydrolase)